MITGTKMTLDEFYNSIEDLDNDQRLIRAIEAGWLFDYICNDSYRYTKDRLADIIKEFSYATYDNLRRDVTVYGKILEDTANELIEHWGLGEE